MDYFKIFKKDKSESITHYLNELSSKAPVPGGGSVAGLTAALGAGLISKVANLTIGKEKYKDVEKEMDHILDSATKFREEFYKLSLEDAEAYKKLSSVFKLPKEERKEKLGKALKDAIDVPLKLCKATHQAIKLCIPLIQKGNKNLITDAAIASIMLKCAFRSALFNVEINLRSIKDPEFISKIEKIVEPIEEDINTINEEVVKETEIYLSK